ncbi:cobalamin biosynthesis protein [Saccharomonospora amisosensis]|uniref:cobalamin biosynthesis protein n=1 Tax=Saccharomonospora amisosensis TaxID=1128677 RepID=UPI00141DE65F|nr:cobalamin biosynthesis protein [Saccharomonospora amisosensis]
MGDSGVGVARAVGLMLGLVADGVIGDPHKGRAVTGFTTIARAAQRRVYADSALAGAVYTGALTSAAVLAGSAAERAGSGRPVVRALTTATATWAVLGGARIAAHGTELSRDLQRGDLDAARRTVSALDSRSADELDATALSRAAVEIVALRSANDVVTPLLWGAVAGIPGLLGSRAVGVLRATTGEHGRCRGFGWVAARLDELVNLLPTRAAAALTVASAPVVGGSTGAALRAWRRDTVLHPSPNAGRVEAAFAGALEIRLGGRTVYHHGVRELPVLGDGRNPDAGHVTRAVELSRVVGWLAGAASVALAALLGFRRRA